MKKLLSLILSLVLAVFSAEVSAKALIPADEAFKLTASSDAGKITLHWDIAQGYYLYKEKISIATDSVEPIGRLLFPSAKTKKDEFFGEVGIYRNQLAVLVPINTDKHKTITLSVDYQGCADVGVCYPPVRKNIQVEINPLPLKTTSKAVASGLSNIGDRALSFGKNILQNIGGNAKNHPLKPEQAFKLSTIQLNNQQLLAEWIIEPEYFLYRDKFNFSLKGAKLGQVIIPKGKIKDDPFFGKVETHRGVLSVVLPISEVVGDKVGLVIGYQGCWDGGVCYPPQKFSGEVALTDMPISQAEPTPKPEPKSTAVKIIETPVQSVESEQQIQTPQTLTKEAEIGGLFTNSNIFWVLLSFFGFGLLLSFTPCVFPMIPILSGILVGQKHQLSTARSTLISLVFVLAMSLVYTIAGVIAGYSGENLQIIFQTPWVLMVFSGVFVLLALSMFGFYDLQLPKTLRNKLDGAMGGKYPGLYGAGLMGALSALIVGPCVAPPLAGALIYIGQTGDAVLGGSALFVMGIGMGVPLLLIGASAGKLLPKAGAWMETVKAVFGILMLAVAIYLLDRITSQTTSLFLWGLLFILSAAGLGTLKPLQNTASPWQSMFKALGLIAITYGFLLLFLVARGGGDILSPLSGWNNTSGQISQNSQTQKPSFKIVKNLAELDNALLLAKQNQQVAMLDFYADWCISCKEIERNLFNNPDIAKKLNTMLLLKADVTKNNNDDKTLMKKFSIIGPPAMLFFKDTKELTASRVIGEMSLDEFSKKLENIN